MDEERLTPVSSRDEQADPQPQRKFSTAEIILGSIVCIILDVIAAIGDVFSFSVLGDLVQWASWLVFTFWFTIKGCSVTSGLTKRYLIPLAADLIPIFPTLIFSFLITTYMENHPEKFATLTKIENIANKVEGAENVAKKIASKIPIKK